MEDFRILPNRTFDYVNTGDPPATVNPAKAPATWLNATSGEIFVCTDNAADANVWVGQFNVAPVTTDPYWDDVVLLLNGDEAAGATTFVDEKGHTMSTSADAVASTTVSLLDGATTMTFDGVSDSVFSSNADFSFGTGDFTIELWVSMGFGPVAYSRILQIGNYNDNGTLLLVRDNQTDNLLFQIYQDGALNPFVYPVGKMNLHHICLQRASGVFYLWIDGIYQASSSTGGTVDFIQPHLRFGSNDVNGEAFKGTIGKPRLTKGVARYNTVGDDIQPLTSYPLA